MLRMHALVQHPPPLCLTLAAGVIDGCQGLRWDLDVRDGGCDGGHGWQGALQGLQGLLGALGGKVRGKALPELVLGQHGHLVLNNTAVHCMVA